MATDYPQNVNELVEKYESLVWYARKPRNEYGRVTIEVAREVMPDTPEDILQRMVANAAHIEMMYSDEVAKLNDDNVSDWTHGFNSGMLAALCMVAPSTKISARALADFPNLCT